MPACAYLPGGERLDNGAKEDYGEECKWHARSSIEFGGSRLYGGALICEDAFGAGLQVSKAIDTSERRLLMERRHLLIIGAPRSGTTLLATMISRHTEIGVLNEDNARAMRRLLGKAVVGNKLCIPNQIEMKKRHPLHLQLWKKLGLTREYQKSDFSIEEYLALPNVRLIAIIRDGNDAISSGMRRGHKSFGGAAYRWCRAVEIIHDLKARYPDLVWVVSFESLVLHPRENMERVAAFVNVNYQERMLEGPLYNPRYPESGMNEEKVNRSNKEHIDFRIAERFPAAARRYQELLAFCEPVAEANTPRVRRA